MGNNNNQRHRADAVVWQLQYSIATRMLNTIAAQIKQRRRRRMKLSDPRPGRRLIRGSASVFQILVKCEIIYKKPHFLGFT